METLLVSDVCIESHNMRRVRNHAASEELVPWSKTAATAGEAGALGGQWRLNAIEPELGARVLNGVKSRKCCRASPLGEDSLSSPRAGLASADPARGSCRGRGASTPHKRRHVKTSGGEWQAQRVETQASCQ